MNASARDMVMKDSGRQILAGADACLSVNVGLTI